MSDIINKLKKNKKVLSVIVLLIIIIVIVVVLHLIINTDEKLNKYSTKNEPVYFYIDTDIYEFDSEVVLDNDDNLTKLTVAGNEWTSDGSPLYFKKQDSALLPTTMSIVFPLEKFMQKKVNYYTELYLHNNRINLKNNNLDELEENCFLFNGYDTYILIDSMTLEINDTKIELSPMSYVQCRNNEYVIVYNYGTKEMTSYDNNDDTKVIMSTNNYSINLNSDSVSVKDKNALLIKKVNKLNNL